MPRVPYAPVPGVAPSEQGIGGVRVDTPGAAFGASVARETEGLGKTIEQAGDRIFSRAVAIQQLNNETEAKEADAQYMIEAGKLHANYNSLEGRARVDAFDQYSTDLQSLRQNMRKGLSNDMARRMFDSSSLSTMSRSIFNGAGAAATAQRQWSENTAKSQIDLDAKTVEDNPDDDALFQDKLRRVRENVGQLSALRGFDPGSAPEMDLALKATSKLWAQRIIGKSRQQPFEAQKMLEEHKIELTQDDYLMVDRSVTASGRAVGSVNIANEVFSEGMGTPTKPQMPLSDMEEEARARAKKLNPDDPLLEQHAVAALRGRFNQVKYAKGQEDATNIQIVNAAIMDGVRDERQLRSNPAVAAAIDALPPDKRKDIPGMINRYNAAKNKTTNEDNYFKLKGMSNNNVEEFLNTDVTKEQLSKEDMDKLLNLQQKLKANQLADPRVNRALTQLRGSMGAQLEALGIFRRTDSNKTEYDHFTGALQSALDVWQETHGKPATYKDVVDTIGPQIIQQRAVPGAIFGDLWPNQKPFYEHDVPANFKEKLVTDIKSRGGLEPTDEQVYKAYVRSQFIKLYGKKQGE